MRIQIDDAIRDKRIFEGNYEYAEGGRTDGKLSFHISVGKKDRGYENYELLFFCESDEELDNLIKNLQEILLKK